VLAIGNTILYRTLSHHLSPKEGDCVVASRCTSASVSLGVQLALKMPVSVVLSQQFLSSLVISWLVGVFVGRGEMNDDG
jgi:hypothetical protein